MIVRFLLAFMLFAVCGMSLADSAFSSSLPQQPIATLDTMQPPPDAASSAGTGSMAKPAGFPGRVRPAQPEKPIELKRAPLLPPLEITGFQKFVQESTGRLLPVYGQSVFDDVPGTFAPVDDIPVTPDYVVGPGDEVVVRIWGQLDADLRLKVDRLGSIYIPKVGSVNVAGLKYQDLKEYLKTAIGRDFRNFDLDANLGQLRSIQVYVVGQARRPGTYTVSSLSTLVNALFASGGPSSSGSMRHIQLKRGDKVVTEFDVYDFLLKGDKSKDVPLLPGDVIYIPPTGPVAAVTGSINVPAVYELKDGTDLAALLSMAGGLSTTAAGQKVEVERIENRRNRVVADFDLDAEGLVRQMKDGDLVRVYSVSPKFENAVTLRGNVANPYRYPWRKGMKISDLIPDREALITRDYWLKKNRIERNSLEDEERDMGVRYRSDRENAGQSGNGRGNFGRDAVKQNKGGRDEESAAGWLLSDVQKSASGINWDYAVIERLDPKNLATKLIPFNLKSAVIDRDPSQNLELLPGDIVTIFSQKDVKVPLEKLARLVTIEGEVARAGVYEAKPGETLRQLVARIGGVTPNAYLFGAEFTRESTRKLQQQRLEESIDRMERDIQKNAGAMAQGAMDQQKLEAAKLQAQGQQAALEKMRGLKATGRIVLEIPPGANSLKDIPDIALEDGDRLYIPATSSTVGVFGEVYNENNAFFYRDEKRVSDYLDQAGGPTRDADAGRIFVLRADGSVISSQTNRGLFSSSFGSMRLMPGDAVVVPEKFDKTPIVKSIVDWSQILLNMGVGIASLKLLGLI